jgi:hypothetical protein
MKKKMKINLMPEQLLLFEDPIEDRLVRKVKELEEALDRNRKSLHAKNGRLQKAIDELQIDMEFIKVGICRAALLNEDKKKCEIVEIALL